MSGAEQTTVIAALDGRCEASLPDWFAAQHPDAEPVTFTGAVRDRPAREMGHSDSASICRTILV
jgi:hypothetical protein